jgi:hypothetical protein
MVLQGARAAKPPQYHVVMRVMAFVGFDRPDIIPIEALVSSKEIGESGPGLLHLLVDLPYRSYQPGADPYHHTPRHTGLPPFSHDLPHTLLGSASIFGHSPHDIRDRDMSAILTRFHGDVLVLDRG